MAALPECCWYHPTPAKALPPSLAHFVSTAEAPTTSDDFLVGKLRRVTLGAYSAHQGKQAASALPADQKKPPRAAAACVAVLVHPLRLLPGAESLGGVQIVHLGPAAPTRLLTLVRDQTQIIYKNRPRVTEQTGRIGPQTEERDV